MKRDRLIGNSARAVWLAWAVNRGFVVAVCVGLGLSWVFGSAFTSMLQPDADLAVRLEMVLGLAMGLATDRLLTTLRAMIASARAGDPFVAANARRLRAMGWWLLMLQLLAVPAWLLTQLCPQLGSAAPGEDVSVGGWLAVLMVFVLARVFAAGADMRDDLAGTV